MASAPIKIVEDRSGNQFFPLTHEQAVIDNNGINLSSKIASFVTSDELERLTTQEVTNLLNMQ